MGSAREKGVPVVTFEYLDECIKAKKPMDFMTLVAEGFVEDAPPSVLL